MFVRVSSRVVKIRYVQFITPSRLGRKDQKYFLSHFRWHTSWRPERMHVEGGNPKKWEKCEGQMMVEEKVLPSGNQYVVTSNVNIEGSLLESILEPFKEPAPFTLLTDAARRPGDAPRIPRGGGPGGGRGGGGARLDLAGEGPGNDGAVPMPPVDIARARAGAESSKVRCGSFRDGGGGTALAG